MRFKLILLGAEWVAFIVGLVALVTDWWKVPQVAPFWQTLGYTCAFIGIALAQVAVSLVILWSALRKD